MLVSGELRKLAFEKVRCSGFDSPPPMICSEMSPIINIKKEQQQQH
jgi:hypothetical protein